MGADHDDAGNDDDGDRDDDGCSMVYGGCRMVDDVRWTMHDA